MYAGYVKSEKWKLLVSGMWNSRNWRESSCEFPIHRGNHLRISYFGGNRVCRTTSFSGSRLCMIRRSTQWGVLRINVESVANFLFLEEIMFTELPVLVVVVYAWSDVVHNEVCSGSMWNQLQISCFTGSHVCGTTSFSGSRRCMIRRSTQWGVLRIDVESVANFLFLEEIVFTEHVRFSYSGLIEEIFELPKLID